MNEMLPEATEEPTLPVPTDVLRIDRMTTREVYIHPSGKLTLFIEIYEGYPGMTSDSAAVGIVSGTMRHWTETMTVPAARGYAARRWARESEAN